MVKHYKVITLEEAARRGLYGEGVSFDNCELTYPVLIRVEDDDSVTLVRCDGHDWSWVESELNRALES